MQPKLIFKLCILIPMTIGTAVSQVPGEWVWIHGSNTSGHPGNFGVQGVSSPTNTPPAFYEACDWTDLNGNFWLFGGLNSNVDEFGDLWKYNPTINEWTWMKGSGLPMDSGNYGNIGIPSATNNPPSRAWGAATWVDNQGNFWLFGGASQTIGYYSDLWRYEPSTNNWTWMKGPQGGSNYGVYGIQGIPDPANFPGGRNEMASAWTDNAGDLWLFGGMAITLNFTSARCNDHWRYNISTNEWTWMKGSQVGISAPDVYGMQTIEDPANTPGARLAYSHWKDVNGYLWLFGGSGDFIEYNDMWRYNPLTNNWAWFKGGSTSDNYGVRCIGDSSNTPGGRNENRATVADGNGNFWHFGGVDYNFGALSYNDLWMYCVATNQWIWISGDPFPNLPGNWGTLGISSPLNKPNGRAGSLMWIDQTGHLYIFGGVDDSGLPSVYNDLWKFTIDTTCTSCPTSPQAGFSAPNQVCPGTCIDFINNSFNSTSYQWTFPGGIPSISTVVNPTNICYATPGSYDVSLIATDANASDTLFLSNYITVFPQPPSQGILQSGDTLFANAGAVSYQWFYNGSAINGATNYFYIAQASGDYNVIATDNNGCEVEAVINNVLAYAQFPVSSSRLEIFPNPAGDKLIIKDLEMTFQNTIEISIYNIMGECVITLLMNESQYFEVDVSALSPGLYLLKLHSKEKTAPFKFVKQ